MAGRLCVIAVRNLLTPPAKRAMATVPLKFSFTRGAYCLKSKHTRTHLMRHILCTVLLASVIAAPTVADASTTKNTHHLHKAVGPAGIGVVVDQARVVVLERPAKSVFVGNPTIADVTVIDARHAFVIGKTFGVTNLIALDADGRQISNQQVTVANGQQAVTYNLASGQFNYSCTHAHCETMPRPGDVQTYWQNTESAIATHEDAGVKYATGAATAQASQQ